MSTISTLFVELRASTSEFSKDLNAGVRDLKAFDRDVKSLTGTLDSMGRGFTQAGTLLTVGLTAPIVAMGTAAVLQFNEAAKASALMENAIRSTGSAANKSADELRLLATSLQGNSIFDDDEIIGSVITQLLSFTNVAGEAFDRGSQAALNMSTVLGQDLQSSAIQVGKALNDPVAGVTALQRVGVKLSEDQKKLVKSFMDVNDIAGAQNVILKELEKEFGGAAKAASEVGSGPMTQLGVRIGNLSESWGGLIQDRMHPFIDVANSVVGSLEKMDDSTKVAVLGIASLAAGIGPVLLGLGQVSFAISSIITLIPRIQAVAVAVEGIGASFAILQGAKTYADISAGVSLIGEASIAATAGMVALAAAVGVGIGMLVNYLIEGTKVEKWLDSFTAGMVGLVHTYESTKTAGELADFTNNAVKNGVVNLGVAHVDTAKAVDTLGASLGASKEAAKAAEAAYKAFRSSVDGLKNSVIPSTSDIRTLNTALVELANQGAPLDKMLSTFGDKAVKMVLDLKALGMDVPPMVLAIAEEFYGPKMKAILDANSVALQAKLDKDHDAWVASYMDAETVVLNALEANRIRMGAVDDARSKAVLDSIDYQTDVYLTGLDKRVKDNDAALKIIGKFEKDSADVMSKAWETAVGNVTSGIAKGLSDAILHAKSFKDSMIGVAKQAADGMLQAFLTGLLSPLTSALGKLGKSLSDSIFGGGSGKGILGGLLGGGGGAGVGASAGTAGIAGGTGGASTMGALLTNPWTAVVAAGIVGVTAWIKSQAHHEANTLVQNVENPFWKAWGQILPSDQAGVLENLDPEKAKGILANLKEMNANYLDLVQQFSVKGSDELKVANQSLANTQGHVSEITAALERAIANGAENAVSGAARVADVTSSVTDDLAHVAESVYDISRTWAEMIEGVKSGVRSAALTINETMLGLVETFKIVQPPDLPALAGVTDQYGTTTYDNPWGFEFPNDPFSTRPRARGSDSTSDRIMTPSLTTNAMGGDSQAVQILQEILSAIRDGKVMSIDGREFALAIRPGMYAASRDSAAPFIFE